MKTLFESNDAKNGGDGANSTKAWTQDRHSPNHTKRPLAEVVLDIILRLSLVILFILCTIMSSFQLRKYIGGQTTLAHSVENWHEKLDFPAISICPGFRRDKVTELVWPSRFNHKEMWYTTETFEDTFPTTREGMDALWDELTFGPDEVLLNFVAAYQPGFNIVNPNKYTVDDLLGKKEDCLSLEQHDTLTGKCYTLTTWCQVQAMRYLHLELNFENITGDDMIVTVHHRKDFLGNNYHLYSGPTNVEVLKKRVTEDYILQTKVNKKSKGDSSITEEDYYECVMNTVYEKARSIAPSGCYHPSFKSIIGDDTLMARLPACANESEYFNSYYYLMEPLALIPASGCPNPAVETSYEIKKRIGTVS